MVNPASEAALRYLIGIDLAALRGHGEEGWERLGDRLSNIRLSSVLVYAGDSAGLHLPDPDYVLDDGVLIRLPSGEEVEGWAKDGGDDLEAAVAHLAQELFVPPSDVVLVLGAGREVSGDLGRVVVLGGDVRPEHGLWVPVLEVDSVIEALETVQLFGRSIAGVADIAEVAFTQALETLRRNITGLGFTAASIADNLLGLHDANYAAVWARDGIITGLWTLCLDDEEITDAFRRTVRLMARHQTPSGQIPANVRLLDEQPDYSGIGGIASIDSVLWYVIGAIRLAVHTGDRELAEELTESIERAMSWLAAHDANNDSLIEIPESSDWMDLFPRSYNVLYDEVLWYQACVDTGRFLDSLGGEGSGWTSQAERIRAQIIRLFWPTGEQLVELAGSDSGRFSMGEAVYLLSQITPFDYGWRCDVYANLLAGLSGLLDERKSERLFTFLWGSGVNAPFPVVCLYPPVLSGAEDWKDYFLVNFLNLPDHYHNGGIWPFIGGLWIRYLATIGRVELAHRELYSLAEACRQGIHGEWEFNEWLHGRTGRPMGKAHQAWSAASYVHAYLTLHGDAPAEAFPELVIPWAT